MPHLANLMIPDVNGDRPLSSHSFTGAVTLFIAGAYNSQQSLDWMNARIVSNGGSQLGQDEIDELSTIKSNFDSKTTAGKLLYHSLLQQMAFACEESNFSGMTSAIFDTALEL